MTLGEDFEAEAGGRMKEIEDSADATAFSKGLNDTFNEGEFAGKKDKIIGKIKQHEEDAAKAVDKITGKPLNLEL